MPRRVSEDSDSNPWGLDTCQQCQPKTSGRGGLPRSAFFVSPCYFALVSTYPFHYRAPKSLGGGKLGMAPKYGKEIELLGSFIDIPCNYSRSYWRRGIGLLPCASHAGLPRGPWADKSSI